jgi:protein-L-isoaspartate O-methyltransferase
VELLQLRDGDRLLEVGCGYGWVTRAVLNAAAVEWVGRIEGIAFIHFNERDVVRHNLVQQIIKAYDEFGANDARRAPSPENGKPEPGK